MPSARHAEGFAVFAEGGGLWARGAAPETGTRLPASVVFRVTDVLETAIPGANWDGPRGDWSTSEFPPLRQANATTRSGAGLDSSISWAWPLLLAAFLVLLAATTLAAKTLRTHTGPDAHRRNRFWRSKAPTGRATRNVG